MEKLCPLRAKRDLKFAANVAFCHDELTTLHFNLYTCNLLIKCYVTNRHTASCQRETFTDGFWIAFDILRVHLQLNSGYVKVAGYPMSLCYEYKHDGENPDKCKY